MMRRAFVTIVLGLWTLAAASPEARGGPAFGQRPAEQPTLASAKELYAGAAYADALTILNTLKGRHPSGDEAVDIDKNRALCLLALGRMGEADEAIDAILTEQPRFRLAEEEVSRRVSTAFQDARRRALPRLAQRAYERGKQAYDHGVLGAAREQFSLAIELASDPDVPADSDLLKDLRTLAAGFLNLATAAAPPVASRTIAPRGRILPAVKDVYDASDEGIVPPVILQQVVPPWPGAIGTSARTTGVVEVIIDEKGEVESATLAPPFNSPYDTLLLEAAKLWRYRPARCAGQPVRFKRRVQVVVGPEPTGNEGNGAHTAAR